MQKTNRLIACFLRKWRLWPLLCMLVVNSLNAQGATSGAISGIVTDHTGRPLAGANVFFYHEPSGTQYSTIARTMGKFNLTNVRIGGPYTITVSHVGYKVRVEKNIHIRLGQTTRINIGLVEEFIEARMLDVTAESDDVFKTGAATYFSIEEVKQLPSIRRSSRDLFRLDPRNDGNFSFAGRSWLYNNILLDGSFFTNPFGLDNPAAGGQANAEPIAYDAIEQIQVAIAPFDVRQSGFTGANINYITRSGDNRFRGSIYNYIRNQSLVGAKVNGVEIFNPDLSFHQTGFSASGPIIAGKLFFFLNGEFERRDELGSNFVASGQFGNGNMVSRVKAEDLQAIRRRMFDAYGYDTGPFTGYTHETNSNKLFLKLNWNIDYNNDFVFRYNLLDAKRDLPPHPFEKSINNAGRGPNENSLPFKNAGYAINNDLDSFAFELNSRYGKYANRAFLSYNRFRDFRRPFSAPFPTIEIAKDGVTYTTLGHEPFSIHNRVEQDVWQITDNLNLFTGNHVLTFGISYEAFGFMNSFNPFYFGSFSLPVKDGGTLFESLEDFYLYTNPGDTLFRDFNQEVQKQLSNPFKEDNLDVGQLALYVQDEFRIADNFNLIAGLRVDFPIYFTDIPENTNAASLRLADENGVPEILDVDELPPTRALFSPRVGFNWDVKGDRSMQIRGGTGIFTGRPPFVWIGNAISNQGPDAPSSSPFLNLNAVDSDFNWPQVWNTNLAVDKKMPWDLLGTLEIIYGNDLSAIVVRNADLPIPQDIKSILPTDGRPYYGGAGNNKLNPDFAGGVYVLDNSSDGYHLNITAQVRKNFDFGLNTSLSYSFTEAKNQLSLKAVEGDRQLSSQLGSRTDILWAENPVQGNPNKPEVSFSEFGNRHRIVGGATYSKHWSKSLATHVGLFFEIADGGVSTASGRSRFSYTYIGDVNGDGADGNDLIYIPKSRGEITFAPILDSSGNVVSPDQQWAAFNAFIEQDSYLKSHRGEIAERNGGINPWFSEIDLRILQDFSLKIGSTKHTFQLSIDILNLGNLLNSNWGVRKTVNKEAKSPLVFTGAFTGDGEPILQYPGKATKTFGDDVSIISRWRSQIGLRYFF